MMVRHNPQLLDLSLGNIDGTHSSAYRGGDKVKYQHRKRHNTINTLWLVGSNGLVVSYIPPESGNHHDMYEITDKLHKLFEELLLMNIDCDGLFINADGGFDYPVIRDLCQAYGVFWNAPLVKRKNRDMCGYDYSCDEMAYEQRFVVERTNAWMDAYRSLLHRFDTSKESWEAWHDLYCIVT